MRRLVLGRNDGNGVDMRSHCDGECSVWDRLRRLGTTTGRLQRSTLAADLSLTRVQMRQVYLVLATTCIDCLSNCIQLLGIGSKLAVKFSVAKPLRIRWLFLPLLPNAVCSLFET